ncbi:MAG: hypothetical protein ACE5GX_11770 [Thermoanaerobaculia bacterium]
MPRPIHLEATVERHHPQMARCVVIPASVVARWKLEGTTVVEGTLNGIPLGRRSLKRWGDDQRPAAARIARLYGFKPAAQAAPPAPRTATTSGAMTGTQHALAAVASAGAPAPAAATPTALLLDRG